MTARECPHCDAADSLELIAVQAAVVFRYACTCCAKETVMHAEAQVEDPTTDLNGVTLEE